jgi:hypothetical protein
MVERLNEDQERIDLKNSEQHQRLEQSTQALHLVANIDTKRQLYAFFCESQPLLTLWSHGPPVRCPLCGARNPLAEATIAPG